MTLPTDKFCALQVIAAAPQSYIIWRCGIAPQLTRCGRCVRVGQAGAAATSRRVAAFAAVCKPTCFCESIISSLNSHCLPIDVTVETTHRQEALATGSVDQALVYDCPTKASVYFFLCAASTPARHRCRLHCMRNAHSDIRRTAGASQTTHLLFDIQYFVILKSSSSRAYLVTVPKRRSSKLRLITNAIVLTSFLVNSYNITQLQRLAEGQADGRS